jgi:ComF family protein
MAWIGHEYRSIRICNGLIVALGRTFDSLIPPRCLLCQEVVPRGQAFCCGCEAELPFNDACCARCAAAIHAGELCGDCLRSPPPFDTAFSPLRYHHPVDHLVHLLKYAENPAMGRMMGRYLGGELLAIRSTPWPDAIIPVALHRDRLRERGYNQALEICRTVSRVIGVPLDRDLVLRRKPTPPQVGRAKKDRQQNMRNAFILRRSPRFDNYAIIDDVITSGATVSAIAGVLRASGVKKIEVWSFARA